MFHTTDVLVENELMNPVKVLRPPVLHQSYVVLEEVLQTALLRFVEVFVDPFMHRLTVPTQRFSLWTWTGSSLDLDRVVSRSAAVLHIVVQRTQLSLSLASWMVFSSAADPST